MVYEARNYVIGPKSPHRALSRAIIGYVGGLVYEARNYVIGVPFLGLLVRVPTWLSPFGGGRTTETGEDNDNFRVEFEMTHPIFGRTVGYSGRCRIH